MLPQVRQFIGEAKKLNEMDDDEQVAYYFAIAIRRKQEIIGRTWADLFHGGPLNGLKASGLDKLISKKIITFIKSKKDQSGQEVSDFDLEKFKTEYKEIWDSTSKVKSLNLAREHD